MASNPPSSTGSRRPDCDLVVVGGGINGVGIARDAVGRGLSVTLVEKDDLAAHTSSASTKLIHGGLRYVEQYEFRLVRKALQEREVLLRAAPHIMWPLRFVMPHDSHLRPAWLIRCGLFLYDHLARRELLPASESVNLREHAAGAPLQPRFTKGFAYSDGWVEDARLVVLTALDAHERGATILTRTRCLRAERDADGWTVEVEDAGGRRRSLRSRALVNATGPWVGQFLQQSLRVGAREDVRLVKGSHIVVRRLFDHPYAYIFQNPDRRIIFAIPYEEDFTLIGTTDVDSGHVPGPASISPQEIDYLCGMSNRYFRRQIGPADVVATYAGLRPLLEDESSDPSSVTRDYSLVLDTAGAPLLSVFGGKITTCRRLAEEAMDRLAPVLGCREPAWTRAATLPGGDLPGGDFEAFVAELRRRFPALPAPLLRRCARAYGSRALVWLDGAREPRDLGAEVLPGLYERELRYLLEHEWARTADDILWRRSKLGLHLGADAASRLDAWLRGAATAPGATGADLSAEAAREPARG